MPDMNWPDAIRKVLQEAEEPLHYKEIADIIGREGLVKSTGATPSKTVSSRLGSMINGGEKIERVKGKRGYYVLPNIAQRFEKEAEAEVAESQAEDNRDSTQVRISAYGLYWERDKIVWKSSGQILGKEGEAASIVVNFADQQGVYLLHNMQTVTYVGRTNAKEKGLFTRLRAHVNNPRRVGRWDRFSWFGLRPVNNDGELEDVPEKLKPDLLITILESVLIETHLPPFNDKGGELMGDLYEQVIDPEIAKERARELFLELAGTD